MGNFEEGWIAYEYRWVGADFRTTKLTTTHPVWGRGDEHKRLLIWSEQGIGTEFMFANFLTHVNTLSKHVEVLVDPRGLEIYRRSYPQLSFSSNTEPVDPNSYDCHLPMGSLPQHLFSETSFRTTNRPYLKSNKDQADQLRKLFKRSKPLVGISWATKSETTGLDRSIKLVELFDSVHHLDLDFISLQYGDVEADLKFIKDQYGIEIQTAESIDNFSNVDGLLSLIEACDVVLSIDNSTVHFAGAIGKETWVMLPFNADWRWFNEGERCMWYPSTRLFRQTELGQWEAVFDQIKKELSSL